MLSFLLPRPEFSLHSNLNKSCPLVAVLLAALAGAAWLPAGAQSVRIVTTVAGQTHSPYGNGGAAAQAAINYSDAIAVDSSGNLYIADTIDQQIRKIDAATGVIAAVAGTGQRGFSGDGQLAVNAQLNMPNDVAVDTAGNVYIADTYNNVIRKVSASTGIITTIAGTPDLGGYSGDGGAATNAVLNFPQGVAVDASGNIYIADSNNDVVRKVTVSTGIIGTFAGTPDKYGFPGTGDGGAAAQATMGNPIGVAFDSAGDLYISDQGNCVIRKVTASTAIISTYAGDNKCGDSGDGGAATSAELGWDMGHASVDSNGNLYIADYSNNAIRKVTASSGVITKIAGNGSFGFSGDGGLATSAALDNPQGVAAGGNGTIYIADRSNLRIRQISSTGTISTIAGNGTTGPVPTGVSATSAPLGIYGFHWYDSVSMDSLGDIYLADGLNNVIRKVTPAGVMSIIAGTGVAGYSGDGGPATSAELNNPSSLTIDSQGNVYIADTENGVVRKVAASNGVISTYAGIYSQGSSAALAVTGDGGPATSAGLPSPTGLAVDSAGDLYIAEGGWCAVRKVTSSGIISTFAGQANNCGGFQGTNGDGGQATSALLSAYADTLAIDSQGNLYIGDFVEVRKVTAATGIITTVAGMNGQGVANTGDGGSALSATLSQIYGLAIDGSGNLYIADTQAVRAVNSSGVINTVAGQSTYGGYSGDGGLATSALISPEGVASDSSGNIYFSDNAGNRIRKVWTSSSTQAAAAAPTFNPPAGDFTTAPAVTISTTTAGAEIFYTLDGSTPNPGTSALYTGPVSVIAPITLSAIAIAPGYSTSSTVSGTYTTGQSAQTITFPALSNVVYGASPITLDATASSGLAVSYTVTGPASVSGSKLTITGAGTVAVTASQAGDSSYTAATPVTQSFTVAKAALTVTADNATMSVGGPFPSFTYTITGWVNHDGPGDIAGSAFETTTATITSPAGTYPITFSTEGFSSPNYTFTYVSGTLTITVPVSSAPAVTLSPGTLTFASQGVGTTSAAQTITLTNSGNAALGITSIVASGSFAETNTCGSSIEAGANCTIGVTFTPAASGALSGAVTITDNAGNSPQTVALSGTGADVSLTTTSTGMTASQGGAATASVQIASAGGFSGTVNLTCSVAYEGSGTAQNPPTCSVSPAQAQVSSGTPVTATLTVNTTASSSAMLKGGWLPAGGSALAALIFFFGVPRRRWKGKGLVLALCVITLGAVIGCGGGSSVGGGGGGGTTGTTAGNYQVTVTATGTASTETMSVMIPLTVQ